MKKPPPKKPPKSPKVRDIQTARRATKKTTKRGQQPDAKKPLLGQRPKKVHRCGDAGGVSRNGRACGKPTASGTRCAGHRESDEAMRQLQKSRVVQLMTEGKRLIEAAREIGRDPATLYKWRMNDPEFDAAVSALVEENEQARVRAVEETLYDRIIAGEAAPNEVMFWLVNRARDRWKNRHSQEMLGADGKPVDQIPVAQLHALAVKIENLNLDVSQADLARLLGVKRVEG